MDFGSYDAESIQVAAALVNHLTPGVDGTRETDVPPDARGRRARARQVGALAGRPLSTETLDRLVTLAAQLREVFEACHVDDVDTAARRTDALLEAYQSAPRLIAHDGGDWHLHFHSERAGLAEGWGASCAAALAFVIGAGEHDRLGICSAVPCDRVFVDVSRNRNRRSCSARCTNRATVAAYRARARQD